MNLGSVVILGGGFGLYGYLPAVESLIKGPVITLLKYKSIFERREDLNQYLDRVEFLECIEDCLTRANTLVIAQRPRDQTKLLNELSEKWDSFSLNHLVIEKPISTNPSNALLILEKLKKRNLKLRVGYTFIYTEWAKILTQLIKKGQANNIKIQWYFEAFHYKYHLDTWKRKTKEGGGALRFYGIQLFGLLAMLGNWNVESCEVIKSSLEKDVEAFRARLRSSSGVKVEISCNSRFKGIPRFLLQAANKNEIYFNKDFEDPFQQEIYTSQYFVGLDRRVGVLRKIFYSFNEKDNLYWLGYIRSVNLWKNCENRIKLMQDNSLD
ncbi:MAG: hypothetical protein H8D45_27130 [Bacteroidetes bacterium]|nr:hypothetical protein [Bacteroidota bacterium]